MVRTRVLWTGVALAILIALLVAAAPARSTERPENVAPEFWKALTPELGLALTRDREGTLHGVFMTRVNGTWTPVYVRSTPAGAQPAAPSP